MYNNLTTIYHLADIHIRKQLHRRLEYQEVFEKLYHILKSKNNGSSLIVICGDLFYEKCSYDDRSLSDAINFLKNLSNIMPVILIAGNHDISVSNDEERDAIFPIATNITGKYPLHYLQYSGIYDFYDNVSFVVSSRVDNKFINANNVNTPKLKICLYHGSVNGQILPNGFQLDIFDKQLYDFDGYDYVLLGDTHKFQYLNKKKTIAYPSSLIQQNYGESLNHHGMIEWNLVSGTSKFIEIPNNYGYLTLEFNDTNNLILPKNLPKNIRLTINYKGHTRSECVNIIDQISKQKGFNVIESKYNEIFELGQIKKISLENKINNVNTQNNYIRDYCTQKLQLTEADILKILSINNEMNKLIEYVDVSRGKIWKLLELRFSNMYTFGKDNYIDFRTKKGIIGIVAPNYYGKSSIFDVLLFALFDKCTKSSTNKDVLNVNKKQFSCEVIISVNNVIYKIRKFSRKTNQTKVKSLRIDFELYEKKDNTFIKISDDDNTIVAKNFLKSIVGEYDHFTFTHMLLQDSKNFRDLNKGSRLDYLERVYGIDIFCILEKQCKESSKRIRHKHNLLKEEINNINVEELKNNLNDHKRLLKLTLSDKKSLENTILMIEKNIKDNYYKMRDLNIDCSEIIKNITDKEVDNWKKSIKIFKSRNETIIEEEKKILQHIKKINDDYTKENIENINNNNELFVSNKRENIEKYRNMIRDLEENKKGLLDTRDEIEVTNEYIALLDENKMLISEIDKVNNIIQELHNNLYIIENKVELESKYNILKEYIIRKKILEKDLLYVGLEVSDLKTLCKEFENFEYNKSCNYCLNNPFTINAREKKNELVTVINKLARLSDENLKLSEEINDNKRYENEYLLMLERENKNVAINSLIQENTRKLLLLENKRTINELNITRNNEEQEKIKYNAKTIKENKNLDKTINGVKVNILSIEESTNSEYCEMNKILNDLSKIKIVLSDLLIEKSQNKEKLSLLECRLTEYEKSKGLIELYKNNERIRKEIDILESDLLSNKVILSEKNASISKLESEINLMCKMLNQRENKLKELDSITAEIKYIDYYLKIVNKEGIPLVLLKDMLNKMQFYVNNVLNDLCDFTIDIQEIYNKKGKLKELEIYKLIGDKEINVSSCSGYERFVINYGLRRAIIEQSNLNRSNFMGLDECLRQIDDSNLIKIENIFDGIRNTFDFALLISHDNNVKSACDKTILLNRKLTNGIYYSTVNDN